jgi:hypothetical protein
MLTITLLILAEIWLMPYWLYYRFQRRRIRFFMNHPVFQACCILIDAAIAGWLVSQAITTGFAQHYAIFLFAGLVLLDSMMSLSAQREWQRWQNLQRTSEWHQQQLQQLLERRKQLRQLRHMRRSQTS